MSTTITADPTQPIPAVLTGPSDGPTARASDVNTPFQALANGLARIATRELADFTALRAISNQVDGEAMRVAGEGWYTWRSHDTAAESLPKIVNPGGAFGRWYSVDANRLPTWIVMEIQSLASTAASTLRTLYPQDVAGSTLTFAKACVATDNVKIAARLNQSDTGSHLAGKMAISVSEDGGSTWADVATTQVPVPGAGGVPDGISRGVSGVYACTVGGTLKVKASCGRVASTAGADDLFEAYSIIAELVRLCP